MINRGSLFLFLYEKPSSPTPSLSKVCPTTQQDHVTWLPSVSRSINRDRVYLDIDRDRAYLYIKINLVYVDIEIFLSRFDPAPEYSCPWIKLHLAWPTGLRFISFLQALRRLLYKSCSNTSILILETRSKICMDA